MLYLKVTDENDRNAILGVTGVYDHKDSVNVYGPGRYVGASLPVPMETFKQIMQIGQQNPGVLLNTKKENLHDIQTALAEKDRNKLRTVLTEKQQPTTGGTLSTVYIEFTGRGRRRLNEILGVTAVYDHGDTVSVEGRGDSYGASLPFTMEQFEKIMQIGLQNPGMMLNMKEENLLVIQAALAENNAGKLRTALIGPQQSPPAQNLGTPFPPYSPG